MDMPMSNLRNTSVEVLTSVQRRRHWTPQQKLEIILKTNEPGNSVSAVAREYGIASNQIFQWRKAYLEGSLVAVGANEAVVPSSELQEAMKRIKQLEGALGLRPWRTRFSRRQWTLPKQKSGLRTRQYCPRTGNKSSLFGSWRVAQPRKSEIE